MAVSKTTFVALGGVLLGMLLTGSAEPASEPEAASVEISTIPVLTASQDVGDVLTACMYPGARPEPFRVVTSSCRAGAEHCTAFVALRSEGDQTLLATFDILNPPVEATGPTCDRPISHPSGVLAPARQ